MMRRTLSQRLLEAFRTHAGRTAVHKGSESWTYAQLGERAAAVAKRLDEEGIGPGERVGIWMEKSIDSLSVLLGALFAGAAYVPIDPRAPARRALQIGADSGLAAIAIDRPRGDRVEEIVAEIPTTRLVLHGGKPPLDRASSGGVPIFAVGGRLDRAAKLDRLAPARVGPEDPAYVLYTSGSTGRPKGVVLSHRAALGFVDWCRDTFAPSPEDRMSSHAPFHFDLSTFDLFVTLTSGASVRLLDSTEAMLPPWIVRNLAAWGITVWYSVPSVLDAMVESGGLTGGLWPDVRLVLFAGEVYPTPKLRKLREALPRPKIYNLYGPTETNVCTYHEVRQLPEGNDRPIPIGRVCEQLRGVVLDDRMEEVPPGTEGTLWIGGANLLTGYWNDSELSDRRLRLDPRGGSGGRLYDTGDRVIQGPDGAYTFLGRRDQMVKVRGYRVELGEIEAALHEHEGIAEAAVSATEEPRGGETRLVAHVVPRGTEQAAKPEEAAIREHLRARLPLYMIPAEVRFHERLPRTSTGKIDRMQLASRELEARLDSVERE